MAKMMCFGGDMVAAPTAPVGLGTGERMSICGQFVIARDGRWRAAQESQRRRVEPVMGIAEMSAPAGVAAGGGMKAARARRVSGGAAGYKQPRTTQIAPQLKQQARGEVRQQQQQHRRPMGRAPARKSPPDAAMKAIPHGLPSFGIDAVAIRAR
eukprot:Hpha_TRINITY_DN34906_c0_g1::TRINITY_DN34906_c0_g1_i1::g.184185::m.184185